jgi:CRP/FNR family cyclic AMP-dependent transcriptional regulator
MNEPAVSAHELGAIGLFRGLPEDDLESLAEVASLTALSDGEILFQQGDPANTLFVVSAGGLVLRASRHGRSVIVETVGPGEVVGWSAMRESATALATARAVGRTKVIAIPVDPIVDLAAGGSRDSRLLVRRIVGLAATQLEASREQLLQAGREGVITAG